MSKIEELLHNFESHVIRMQTISDIPIEDLAYEVGLAGNAILLYTLHTEAQLELVTDMCRRARAAILHREWLPIDYFDDVTSDLDTAISIGGMYETKESREE